MLTIPKATALQFIIHWSVDLHFRCVWFFPLTSGAAVGSFTPVSLCSWASDSLGNRPGEEPLHHRAHLSTPLLLPWLHQRVPLPSAVLSTCFLTALPTFSMRLSPVWWRLKWTASFSFAFPPLLGRWSLLFTFIWFLCKLSFFGFHSLIDSDFT